MTVNVCRGPCPLRRLRYHLLALVIAGIGALMLAGFSAEAAHEDGLDKRPPGEYFELRTEDDVVVVTTGLYVHVGDRFLAADNTMYRVVEVDGDVATVTPEGSIDLPAVAPVQRGMPMALPAVGPRTWYHDLPGAVRALAGERQRVAIFHTHSAEAYEPTDGDAFVEQGGGIFDVGQSLAAQAEAAGLEVIHDLSIHEPHDAQAYQRSRRTVQSDLLAQEPEILIDVHRDTTPAEDYLSEIDGETVAQVMLVVGRQNPNMAASDAFAQRVKAVVDEHKPGLMRGIFYADGDYNQDLSDRLLLAEIGTYQNEREHAERGAAHFGEVLPNVIGAGPTPAEQRAPWTTLGLLLAALVLGGAAWLIITTGGTEPALARVRSWLD